ncbi:MAG: hypothetical protein V7720_15215 [Halioglobus sp.]
MRIRAGESSRQWVTGVLGQPDAQLDGGNFWVYGETRMVIYDMAGPGTHEYQSLLVVFKNEVVESYEILESRYGCWSTGLCLVSGWIDSPKKDRPATLDREKTAVVSQRHDDSQAKSFAPRKEQCGVYFYKAENIFFGKQYAPSVSIGSIKDEPLHYKGYLFLAIPSGTHIFSTVDRSIDFECEGGERLYFEVKQELGWTDSELIVRRVNEKDGKAAVTKRNLLLTW